MIKMNEYVNLDISKEKKLLIMLMSTQIYVMLMMSSLLWKYKKKYYNYA